MEERFCSGFVASFSGVVHSGFADLLRPAQLIRMEISDDDEVDEAAAIALCRNVADTLKIIGQAQLHRSVPFSRSPCASP